MDMKRVGIGLLAALFCVSGAGCKKSESGAPAGVSAPADSSTVRAGILARVHWLGKKRLAAETNAASFLDLWNLPESAKLEAQTLDRLSSAPWRLLRGDGAATNAPTALLRPLLDDLVQEEVCLEIRRATNQPCELALAIRLNGERARLWQTNLAAALESLTGLRAVAVPDGRGWSLKPRGATNFVELVRVSDWTLVGMAPERNTVLADMLVRIQRDHAPFAARTTNFWLEADLYLPRIADALSLGTNLSGNLPALSVAAIGDGENVRTRGELNFARPPSLEWEPWNLPTNLIQQPLISFTAIRGIRPWLASVKAWDSLRPGAPPNQVCMWALYGFPVQTYLAAPLPDASNSVNRLTKLMLDKVNPWLATNDMGSFARSRDFVGATWAAFPYVSPFFQAVTSSQGDFFYAGTLPAPGPAPPLPPRLFEEAFARTNLVYYDWERTGPRMETWLYISQLARLVSRKAQLPTQSASVAWYKAVTPRLADSVTSVTRTKPDQFVFVRKSTLGFTGVEMQFLADWLESPQFPRGLHTFLTPPDAAGQP